MTRESSPPQGHDSDGEPDDSIARTLVEDEILQIDRSADKAATRAIRAGRADLLEELTEHLHEVADWIEEEGAVELEKQGVDFEEDT